MKFDFIIKTLAGEGMVGKDLIINVVFLCFGMCIALYESTNKKRELFTCVLRIY